MKRRPSWRMQLGLFKTIDPTTRQFVAIPVENDRRFSHTWVIGKTGTGKSTAMVRWAIDDIVNGEGIAVFDPHGDLVNEIIARIPRSRRADVIYFNPAEMAIGLNVLDHVPEARKAFVAASVADSFKSAWGYDDIATPTLDQFLTNGARAMMDMPDGTLFGLKFLLTSTPYRQKVISHLRDPVISDFWRKDFSEHMPEREQRLRTLSTLNKLGALISDPAVRNCIAQPHSRLDFPQILANGKILLVALPQGRLGIEKSALLGSLMVSQLHLAALSREKTERPFHVYVDECHHFAPGTLAEMLSGIRKFGVSLVLAHQYADQLPRKLRAALVGTVGTTVAFRTGVNDAALLEPEFMLNNSDDHLYELPSFKAWVRTEAGRYLLSMPKSELLARPSALDATRRWANAQLAVDAKRFEQRLQRFVDNVYGGEIEQRPASTPLDQPHGPGW